MTDALPTSVSIAPVNSAELTAGAQSALQVAQTFVVDSPAMYELAGQELADTKAQIATLTARREEITKPLTAAHKSVMALFKAPLDFLEQTKHSYSTKMVAYHEAQERIRQQEQARLEAAARAKRAELEAEAQKALAAAAKSNDAGAVLEAQAQLEIAASVTAPAVAIPQVTATGTSIRGTWKARVTDKAEFVKYIAANCATQPELLSYLEVADSALNAAARLHKGQFKLGGMETYLDKGITSRK